MILDKLSETAKERVKISKENISADEIKSIAMDHRVEPFIFENTLKNSKLSFICEVKKASPSKGIISEEFDYLRIASDYEEAGVDCISVLTEPTFFLGKNEYLKEISQKVSIPILRKDFTVDEYMIYEARALGASCVLIICAITKEDDIKRYIQICDELGLSAIVETHNKSEIITAVNSGARIVGVNNRNLNDFTVNIDNCSELREAIPSGIITVAESGIKTSSDIKQIALSGFDAVLIGETLMKSADKKITLNNLKEEL